MRIEPATPADAEAITDVHLDAWEETYTHLSPAFFADRRAGRAERIERWRGIIASDASAELLAWSDGADSVDGPDGPRLVGFVSTGPGRLTGEAAVGLPALEVMALYVRAEVYGTGVGHALLTAALGDAAAYLWVLGGNDRAIRFYERQGFAFDGCEEQESIGVHRRMARGAI